MRHIWKTSALAALILAASTAGAQTVIPLWAKGQPGFESRRDIPEQHADWWWRSINNPSLTVYAPAPDKNSGTAIIIAPGGGHENLVFHAEGEQPAQYLQNLGVTAFALKYVLAREKGSPYSIEGDAKADLVRAIRYVRAHAAQYGINPHRIGIMGFSAGGELTSMAAFNPPAADPKAPDPIDRIDARPDFLIEIYPGPLGLPPFVDHAPPPVFLLNGSADRMAMADTDAIERLYDAWPAVPFERHVMAGIPHAFNMGDRSDHKTVRDWPQRLADWLSDMGWLTPAATTTPAK
ncbi:alpha/beta hydrolase [Asticcacaulis sp. EMRT-3]|uniref:alpha/beta hydrolase n=1 Tax=Asticcacaulis sp. EMRT-3 TaxID=3040349 RepID=UPI0024AE8DB9|nr:alpha/beta hydrolase [Asticcacaulis sp. EMRT-3]MDI7776101.1 alpha/beta hydrolase [Asticcacaulis sp. EMRT-3]